MAAVQGMQQRSLSLRAAMRAAADATDDPVFPTLMSGNRHTNAAQQDPTSLRITARQLVRLAECENNNAFLVLYLLMFGVRFLSYVLST
jgi:hypothetical protein